MRLDGITLKASCVNCRHCDKDENTAYRYWRKRIPGTPPVFCPEKGIKEVVCVKFLPRKKEVMHAIWEARNKAHQEAAR